ncbi:MAG: TatD family hydrolase [Bacilli bacterium]|nr:TatD family hydrolase [Bacilli bacterium]
MSYLDSHCHLNDEAFLEDYEEAIKRAQDSGVRILCVIGWDVESSKKAIEIAKAHEGVYAMVGFHPENLEGIDEESFAELKRLAKGEKVIAIGEIGLDYHWFKDPKDHEKQKVWFKRQILLANELGLPISIHAREALGDTLSLLKENKPLHGGVLHCYSGSKEMIPEFAKLGLYFGFDGPITFKNAKTPKEAVLACPNDRILSETDSPYMAPTPNRGKRNEPAYIPLIVEEMAKIKGKTPREMECMIEENFQKLFHVKR